MARTQTQSQTQSPPSTSFRHMAKHGISAAPRHDELSREDFVQSLHSHVFANLLPGNKEVYESRVLPNFVRQHNRLPRDRQEVRKEMRRDPYHQVWSALRRTSQEMMWIAAGASVSREDAELRAKTRVIKPKGSLELDPKVAAPRYLTAVDIHCMPGGYCGEVGDDDDVYAAAIYDRGVYSLTQGFLGPKVDAFGHTVVGYLNRTYPDLKPRKILDVGCGIGHGSVPMAARFPEAEFQAVDVAAPMLRYAFARAESMGQGIHFSQQDAESLNFDDNSFDLAVTTAVMHELSTSGIKRIMSEIHRVLRKGGLMAHMEQPQYAGMGPYEQFMRDWDTFGNAEPFWGTLHDMDLEQLGVDAGFDRANISQTMEPGDSGQNYRVGAKASQEDPEERPRNWFFFTATK